MHWAKFVLSDAVYRSGHPEIRWSKPIRILVSRRDVPIADDPVADVLNAANAVTIRAELSRADPDAVSGGHGDCRFFRKSCNMI